MAKPTHGLASFGGLVILLTLLLAHADYTNADSSDLGKNLFATITSYTSTINHLKRNKQCGVFEGKSLKAQHRKLKAARCTPQALYMVGRHAARYPDAGEMRQFNDDLSGLVAAMQRVYPDFVYEPFQREKNNLITPLGEYEQQQLASRLRAIYPMFFDAHQTRIELGTTTKLRTAQSAAEFARYFRNFDLGQTCRDAFRQGDERTKLACYQDVMKTHSQIELEYHKICKKKIIESRRQTGYYQPRSHQGASSSYQHEVGTGIAGRIASLKAALLESLAITVSGKLRHQVTAQQVKSAFEACRYEVAEYWHQTSFWCKLFDKHDLAALEYLEDADIYHRMSSRIDSNTLMASPLTKEILNTLRGSQSLEAHFGFTHVGVLKKIMATFGFYDQSDGYSDADLDAFERATSKKASRVGKRRWRTSLMVPFSGSINFVLYNCPKGGPKVLTAISERVVRVRGCRDSVCPLREFMDAYGHLMTYDNEAVCQAVANALDGV